jgi:hypothetical protein
MKHERLRNDGMYRISSSINRFPAVNIHHAQRYSEALGLPLQWFVTINFTLLGIPPDLATALFRNMLAQRFAPWLRRSAVNKSGLRPTYIWVMEAAGGHVAVHWVLHLPASLRAAFRSRVFSWMREWSTTQEIGSALQMKPVTNIVGLRRYMLKGVNPTWAAHLGVRPVEQGKIIGKRSGFSRI